MKTQIFAAKSGLALLTQTAIEQYILMGSKAEGIVCGLVNIAEEMEKRGDVDKDVQPVKARWTGRKMIKAKCRSARRFPCSGYSFPSIR